MLTVLPSPDSRLITTPGTCARASAMFLAGNCAMFCALITSTMELESRLSCMFWSTDWRKLVTTTVCKVVGLRLSPFLSLPVFFSSVLLDCAPSAACCGCAAGVAAGVAAAAAGCVAKAAVGALPMAKVAKASAMYSGLRVNTCDW